MANSQVPWGVEALQGEVRNPAALAGTGIVRLFDYQIHYAMLKAQNENFPRSKPHRIDAGTTPPVPYGE